MNKNLKIILIIVIVLIIIMTIGALIVAFLTGEKITTENANTNSNEAVTNTTPATNATQNNSNTTSITGNDNTNIGLTNSSVATSNLEEYLKATASIFSERFGSYSNQSDFENLTKSMIYMSESMQKWADQYIKDQRKNVQPDAEYSGISTKVLSIKTISLEEDKGKAEFTASTQRIESSGSTGVSNVFYQDIVVKFIKEKGAWKIDEAKWQDV